MTPPQPTNNFTDYRAAVSEALAQSPQEWTFKSDPRYRRILEHVTPEQGQQFLGLVEAEYPDLRQDVLFISMVKATIDLNDSYGLPICATYSSLMRHCSPSNFRYLYHALRVLDHVQSLGITSVSFLEVGGGYGGLALYVFAFARFFDVRTLSYTIFDLPEVAALQNAYAREALHFPVWAANGLDAAAVEKALQNTDDGIPRYFISCYAFSEFDAETRSWYETRVARRCAHGFLVWNFHLGHDGLAEKRLGGPLYPFVDAPLETEPERPNSGPGNLVVRF